MVRLEENPRDVITRSDIPRDFLAVSMDNSVYARMTSEPDALKSEQPGPLAIRRLLALFRSIPLRKRHRVQFVYSQAMYYDRLNDNSQDSILRLLEALVIGAKIPSQVKSLMEWPVARVDALLQRFPKPTSVSIESQDGHSVERMMIPITKVPDPATEIGKVFKVPVVGVTIPLCIYEPDERDDQVAGAFGFASFSSVPATLIRDVCHVASHYRFADRTDVLLALDSDILKRSDALANVGIRCLTPTQFLEEIDPKQTIRPVPINT